MYYFILFILTVAYECQKCDFASYTEKGLTMHSRTHMSEWACQLCSSSTDESHILFDMTTMAEHLIVQHHKPNQVRRKVDEFINICCLKCTILDNTFF